jgi:hypothetical protein
MRENGIASARKIQSMIIATKALGQFVMVGGRSSPELRPG